MTWTRLSARTGALDAGECPANGEIGAGVTLPLFFGRESRVMVGWGAAG